MNVTTFEAGTTITLQWLETVPHPGHYRIAVDLDGQDDLMDPPQIMDFYSNDTVLLDNIADNTGTGMYEATVTLPEMTCDNCTLQLIQVMYDKAPPMRPNLVYGDDDIYYQCADIRLVAPGSDVGTDMGADTTLDMAVDASTDMSTDVVADTTADPDPADIADVGDATGGDDDSFNPNDESHDSGCGCAVRGSSRAANGVAWLLVALGAVFVFRRRV